MIVEIKAKLKVDDAPADNAGCTEKLKSLGDIFVDEYERYENTTILKIEVKEK